MIISTFNIQNDINKYDINKTKSIISYLNKNKIDILCLQEVYKKLDKDLVNMLSNYNIYGKYRYLLGFIFYKVNERVPIISKYKIINKHTYYLPFIPSLKRVMTKIVIEVDGKLISIYNTHLDYMFNKVKEKQLKKIYKIISKDKNYIILMGDFNLKNNNIIFNKFINKLKDININHIDILEKTLKKSKYHRAIDHIFISDKFRVNSKKLITDMEISDHYPVLVSIDF